MLEYELIQARAQELQQLARHEALVREAVAANPAAPSPWRGLLEALRQRRVRALSPRAQLNEC